MPEVQKYLGDRTANQPGTEVRKQNQVERGCHRTMSRKKVGRDRRARLCLWNLRLIFVLSVPFSNSPVRLVRVSCRAFLAYDMYLA
jgi:hypothetical protein